MYTKEIRKLIFLMLCCFATIMAYAQDLPNYITAADFSYECLGSNKLYKIKLDIYAECGNNQGDLAGISSFSVTATSKKLEKKWDFNLIKKESQRFGEKIKIFCEQRPTNCESNNGDRGLTKYHYEGTLDLTKYDVADDWLIVWQKNLRSYVLASTLLDVTDAP